MRRRNLVGLSFTSPGFPIYRTLMVPKYVNGELKEIIEVEEDKVRIWEEVLQGLRNYIKDYHKTIEKLKSKPDKYEYYETLADIITLYFRQPLQLDPIPSVIPSPLKIYTAIRKIQFIMDVYRDDPLETLKILINSKEYVKIATEIRPDLMPKLVESWLSFPADTRPGYNTSGLIPHLLTTSAIAWALAVEDELNREDAAKARLVALLHDMSKPFNYRRHWEIADKVVELILDRDVLGSEIVDELIKAVKIHHIYSGDKIGDIIHRADMAAASVDRLGRLTEDVLGKDLGEKFRVLYGPGEQAWQEWSELEKENSGKIRELSRKFIDTIKKDRGNRITQNQEDRNVEDGKILYFLVDIGGIQDFIYRTVDLRTVAASSYVIDFVTSAYIMMGLQHYLAKYQDVWIPVEAFMINGGGKLSFIAPRSLAEVIEKTLETINANLRKHLGTRLYYCYTVLTDNFGRADSKATALTNLQKIRHNGYLKMSLVPLPLCKYCNTNTVENDIENTCKLCSELHEIGGGFHFKEKWCSELYLLPGRILINRFTKEYDRKMDLMYIISGHNIEEYYRGDVRKRNVAVVKFDANMMGVFFAESVSLTDALERSWRVDMAMKIAYQKTLCEMYEAVSEVTDKNQAELAVRQCYLGTLYMGGDDGLIICPSWASIPIAIGLSKYFNEEVGGTLTLSVGLVATPPEHDIWSSIEAASALLEEAKGCGRKIAKKCEPKTDEQIEGFAALCFDVIEGGTISSSAVRSRYAELRKEGLTVQPFIVGGKALYAPTDSNPSCSSLENLLNNLLDAQTDDLRALYKICWKVSRNKDGAVPEDNMMALLKGIRSVLKETPEIVKTSKEIVLKLSFTYWNRQFKKEGREEHKSKAYKSVINAIKEYFLKPEKDLQTPIADIDRLIKIIGGGVI
jgi:HD superfamily phosphodiesterase